MKAGPAIWLPVILGALAGVLFAVAGGREPPPKVSAEAPASISVAARSATPSAAEVPPGPIASLAEPASPPPATLASAAPEASAGAGAAGGAAASPTQEGRRAPAFDLSPPATAEELYRIEVRCDRKSPEDCERTARTIDAGTFQPRDAKRAFKLRRAALTLYVKQCNVGRVLSCARLREMYMDGEMVKASTVSANALRDRIRQLCAQKPTDPGCEP